MKPDYLHAMYSYARVCRAMYLNNSNEEYVGRFKAEAMDWFELLTEIHPDFPHGYYYLGYAYVNIGLYTKAQIVWKKFMKTTRVAEEKKEIRERLEQIEEAVIIEAGYNDILAGRYEDGIVALEPFKSSGYSNWWPLYYYLGIAYEMTGRREEAIASLKKVLQINGSHIETMKEILARITLTPKKTYSKDALKSILEYCCTHFTEDISLETLSKELHLNKSYISQVLNQQTNMSLRSFVNTLRVDAACRMLRNTERSITEIAQDVGYDSIRSFNRAFSGITSMTPKDYRNRFHKVTKNSLE
jgi:AraC-like DNA-binding protein